MQLVRNSVDVQMTEMIETIEQEGTTVPERRESERWTSPRIILTVIQLVFGAAGLVISTLGFLFVIGTAIFASYALSQRKDATSEMTNAQLAQQFSALGIKLDKLTETVAANTQTNTREMTELKNDAATLRRDLDNEAAERKSRDGWLEARIVSGK